MGVGLLDHHKTDTAGDCSLSYELLLFCYLSQSFVIGSAFFKPVLSLSQQLDLIPKQIFLTSALRKQCIIYSPLQKAIFAILKYFLYIFIPINFPLTK